MAPPPLPSLRLLPHAAPTSQGSLSPHPGPPTTASSNRPQKMPGESRGHVPLPPHRHELLLPLTQPACVPPLRVDVLDLRSPFSLPQPGPPMAAAEAWEFPSSQPLARPTSQIATAPLTLVSPSTPWRSRSFSHSSNTGRGAEGAWPDPIPTGADKGSPRQPAPGPGRPSPIPCPSLSPRTGLRRCCPGRPVLGPGTPACPTARTSQAREPPGPPLPASSRLPRTSARKQPSLSAHKERQGKRKGRPSPGRIGQRAVRGLGRSPQDASSLLRPHRPPPARQAPVPAAPPPRPHPCSAAPASRRP